MNVKIRMENTVCTSNNKINSLQQQLLKKHAYLLMFKDTDGCSSKYVVPETHITITKEKFI